MSGNRTLVSFDTGDFVTVQAGEEGIRFLLISGKPIEEPVAWHGPVVMNTREELIQAFDGLATELISFILIPNAPSPAKPITGVSGHPIFAPRIAGKP